MKNLEIEKKFLLTPCSIKRFLKEQKLNYRVKEIEQFYLPSKEFNSERYRKIDDRYIHTQKKGAGLVRKEYEIEISKAEYQAKKRLNRGGVIKKRRYIVEIDNLIYELDAFGGALKGLNFLEIEFKDLKEAKDFKIADIFKDIVIAEVTNDFNFTNASISKSMKIPRLNQYRDTLNILAIKCLIKKGYKDVFKSLESDKLRRLKQLIEDFQELLNKDAVINALDTIESLIRESKNGKLSKEELAKVLKQDAKSFSRYLICGF